MQKVKLHNKKNVWIIDVLRTITFTKVLMSNLSILVRTDQFNIFRKICKPSPKIKILDVGVTSDETLKDSNIFERLYKYPHNLVAATIEDLAKFKKLYPHIKSVKIYPNKKLPFKDNTFDVVTAWATLEHVGGYEKQAKFINELSRVGKKVFITTPYRGCIYEPHTEVLLLHWLPLLSFRKILRLFGKNFWANEDHLNPLFVNDVKRMSLNKRFKIKIYKTFGLIPSHLIIHN